MALKVDNVLFFPTNKVTACMEYYNFNEYLTVQARVNEYFISTNLAFAIEWSYAQVA